MAYERRGAFLKMGKFRLEDFLGFEERCLSVGLAQQLQFGDTHLCNLINRLDSPKEVNGAIAVRDH